MTGERTPGTKPARQPKSLWAEALAGLLLALVVLGAPAFLYWQRTAPRSDQPGEVRMVAHRYEDGGWQPSTIRIKAGEKVRLHLTSEDVAHGFLAPELGLESGPIVAGQEKVLELTVSRPGVYTVYCNVFCSRRHGAMAGKLVVE